MLFKKFLFFFFSFLSLSNQLLTTSFVTYLGNSGALFINCCAPALTAVYGKATSNSPKIPDEPANMIFRMLVILINSSFKTRI